MSERKVPSPVTTPSVTSACTCGWKLANDPNVWLDAIIPGTASLRLKYAW